MEKIFLLSDAHLGAQNEQVEKLKSEKLCSFLEFVYEQHGRLIICGDLFDFWFEYSHVVPKLHFRVLSLLARLIEKGLQVDYICGNHDFWLNSFIRDQVGISVHQDELIINGDSQKIYIRHGDGLLKNDYLYRCLKKILRSRICIMLYRCLHPDIGIPVALFAAHLSRNAAKSRPDYCDVDYRQYSFQKIEQGFDMVVLGHTHWPALEAYKNGWYINPGMWMNKFTFAVIENNKPTVFSWDGKQPQPVELSLPPGNIK